MGVSKGKRILFSNMGFLSGLQAMNYIAPLVVLPYLTRVLGVEGFGAVMLFFAALNICAVITDYGQSISANYIISRLRDEPKSINKLVSKIFTIKALLILSLMLSLGMLSQIQSLKAFQPFFIFGFLSVIGQAFQPVWLFQGIERMKDYTVYMGATKLIYIGAVFLMVKSESDAALVILCWAFAQMGGCLVSLVMMTRLGYRISFSGLLPAWGYMKESFQFFLSRVAVLFYTSASTLIVGMVGLGQVALYASSEQAYKAGQALTGAVNQALYPYMAKSKDWRLFFSVVGICSFLLFIGAMTVSYFGEFFIVLVFGESFIEAVPILKIFMFTLVVNYLSASFGYPACAAIGRLDIANKSVIVSALVYAGMMGLLYVNEQISAMSVAVSILVIEFFVVAVRVAWVLREGQAKLSYNS